MGARTLRAHVVAREPVRPSTMLPSTGLIIRMRIEMEDGDLAGLLAVAELSTPLALCPGNFLFDHLAIVLKSIVRMVVTASRIVTSPFFTVRSAEVSFWPAALGHRSTRLVPFARVTPLQMRLFSFIRLVRVVSPRLGHTVALVLHQLVILLPEKRCWLILLREVMQDIKGAPVRLLDYLMPRHIA